MTRLAARTSTSAAAAAAAAVLLAGCAYTSPSTTQLPYEPADGTGAAIGDVLLRNVLLVAEEEGAPGSLIGVVANRGLEDAEVEFSLTDGSAVATVDVPANTTVQLGPDGEEVVVDSVPLPGSLVPMDVRTAQGGEQIRVQVFLPEGPYEGYGPSGDGGGGDDVNDPGGESEDEPGRGDVDDEGEGSDA